MSVRPWLVAVTCSLLVLAACGGSEGAGGEGGGADGSTGCEPAPPESLVPRVERVLEHDPEAYTQGLTIAGGRLYESTGRYGQSSIRELDPDTGEVIHREALPDEVFAEGLTARDDGDLVQLTWKEGIAYVRDPGDLREVDRFTYDGEGWGLTTLDDGTLVMSDGSDELALRDPDDFEVLERWRVERADGPADQLNELDWDGAHLWANRYRTDEVLRIDPTCGTVTGVLDVGVLTTAARRALEDSAGSEDAELGVSNGVAHLPGTDRYLLTGKDWPTMYEVTITDR